MEQLHAHEVLHMMEGNSYTELSLREAIIQKFGEQQRFFTCSANNMEPLSKNSASSSVFSPALPTIWM